MSGTQTVPTSPSSVSTASTVLSFVESVNLDDIASLAISARQQDSSASLDISCTVDPTYKRGAFNVVWFIDFSDGVQWVLRTPIQRWTPGLEKRLTSDILTVKLIQSRTSLPIPTIHGFSTDTDNLLGRPYILMDRVKGTRLSDLWFNPEWFTEGRRKTVWRSLASNVAQLSVLEFPMIGTLEFDSERGQPTVGPLLPLFEELNFNGGVSDDSETGPYNTVHAYLLDGINKQIASASSIHEKASLSLLRLYAGALPDSTLDGPPFVLSIPDFNYQNIFVDERGEVVGLIDWDGMMVGPRQGGYARYPSWITRDWDPLMHAWPQEKSTSSESEDSETCSNEEDAATNKPPTPAPPPCREDLHEDSPATLKSFRDEYLAAFTAVDPVRAEYTRDSQVFEALEIAISNKFCRHQITWRLTQYVFGKNEHTDEAVNAWDLEECIKGGDWVQSRGKDEGVDASKEDRIKE